MGFVLKTKHCKKIEKLVSHVKMVLVILMQVQRKMSVLIWEERGHHILAVLLNTQLLQFILSIGNIVIIFMMHGAQHVAMVKHLHPGRICYKEKNFDPNEKI